ncbi:MAG: type II toxin-antitoxin system HicA family toxin [Phycisphaeraceae bacterium]
MKRRDLEKHLKKHGCRFHIHGGDHDIWVNPETGKRVPLPRHNEIKTQLGKGICKTLGIPIIKKK